MGIFGPSQSSCILYGVELTTFAAEFLANGGRWDSLIEEGRGRRVARDEAELSLESSLKIPDVDAETESDEEESEDEDSDARREDDDAMKSDEESEEEESDARPELDEEVVRMATEIGRRNFAVADCLRKRGKNAKTNGHGQHFSWHDDFEYDWDSFPEGGFPPHVKARVGARSTSARVGYGMRGQRIVEEEYDYYAEDEDSENEEKDDKLGRIASARMGGVVQFVLPYAERCPCIFVGAHAYAGGKSKLEEGHPNFRAYASLPSIYASYSGTMNDDAGQCDSYKVPHLDDVDPLELYGFRKIVQDLLIPAGIVDLKALAERGNRPRLLYAKHSWPMERGPPRFPPRPHGADY